MYVIWQGIDNTNEVLISPSKNLGELIKSKTYIRIKEGRIDLQNHDDDHDACPVLA